MFILPLGLTLKTQINVVQRGIGKQSELWETHKVDFSVQTEPKPAAERESYARLWCPLCLLPTINDVALCPSQNRMIHIQSLLLVH